MRSLRLLRWQLAHSHRPILFGPWTGELGLEVMYWQPFCHWLTAGLDVTRLYAVGRGGSGALVAGQWLDLYGLRPLSEVKAQNIRRGLTQGHMKHLRPTRWDQAVVRDAARHWTLRSYTWIHPSVMYRATFPWQRGRAPFLGLMQHMDWTALPLLPLPVGLSLPRSFYAVKFYGRPTLPLSPDLRRTVVKIVTGLQRRAPVVTIQTTGCDDHADLDLPVPGLVALAPVDALTSVSLQAAVIQRARGFVGTYGGTAQLALRCGIPSLSFYQGGLDGTFFMHLALSHYVSLQTKIPFTVQNLAEMGLWSPVHDAVSSLVRPVVA